MRISTWFQIIAVVAFIVANLIPHPSLRDGWTEFGVLFVWFEINNIVFTDVLVNTLGERQHRMGFVEFGSLVNLLLLSLLIYLPGKLREWREDSQYASPTKKAPWD